MLENRAVDHMFAFLKESGLPVVEPGRSYPNHLDPRDPNSRWWAVNPDATYAVPLDPPHSHLSVMKQLNGARRPRMDGFVAAYVQKAAGKEKLPIIDWSRIKILAVALPIALGGVTWLLGYARPALCFSWEPSCRWSACGSSTAGARWV